MRLIDADALKKQYYPFPCAIGVENAVTIRAINDAPTIDATPIVHGKWISMGNCRCDCSICGGTVLGRTDRTGWADSAFCGYCGAYMRGEGAE